MQRALCDASVLRVQFVIGWPFHVWAVRSIRRGSANMYALISLGTNAAYFYSLFSIIYARVSARFRLHGRRLRP